LVFGKKEMVGLDIGSSSIKLAEVKETRNGYQLKNVGEAPLPPEAITNKVIADSSAVAETISELVSDLGIKTKDAVISLSGDSVIVKNISFPRMSEKELRGAILWELEQNVPRGVAGLNYDFQILPTENQEGNNMDVLIVAAKKDMTEDYMAVARQAGLNPVVVDVDVFALENMFDINYKVIDEVIALVNIGASLTNINILKGGVSVFARDINIGGKQFTEWIQKEFDTGYDEAERMKYSIGSNSFSIELDRIGSDFTDLICGEIERTMGFFIATSLKEKVSKIMLGGGSSKAPYLKDKLSERTGAPVEIINPFKNILYLDMDFDPEYILDIAPKMGVVIGLALRLRRG
jgi:type IV pilus assembly protein PilM